MSVSLFIIDNHISSLDAKLAWPKINDLKRDALEKLTEGFPSVSVLFDSARIERSNHLLVSPRPFNQSRDSGCWRRSWYPA